MSLVQPVILPPSAFPSLSNGLLEKPRWPGDDWEYLRNNPKSWEQLRFLNLGFADPNDPAAGLTEDTTFGGRNYHWIVQGQGARTGSYVGLTREGTLLMNAQAGLATIWDNTGRDAIAVGFKTDYQQATANAPYTRYEIAAKLVTTRASLSGIYPLLSWYNEAAASMNGFGLLCLGTTTLFGYATRTAAGVTATGQNTNSAALPLAIGASSEVSFAGNLVYYEQTYLGTRGLQTAAISNFTLDVDTGGAVRAYAVFRVPNDAVASQCEWRGFRARVRRDPFYETARV